MLVNHADLLSVIQKLAGNYSQLSKNVLTNKIQR